MTELEQQLLAQKINMIAILQDQLHALNDAYQPEEFPGDKPLAYYDAVIDLLKKNVKIEQEIKPELITKDKTDQERVHMSKKELKQLDKQNKKLAKQANSFLATLEQRASLNGRIQVPDNIIIRFRGHGIDPAFQRKYPFGHLL